MYYKGIGNLFTANFVKNFKVCAKYFISLTL